MGMVKPVHGEDGKFKGSVSLGGKTPPLVDSSRPSLLSSVTQTSVDKVKVSHSWEAYVEIRDTLETLPCGCTVDSGCTSALGEDCMQDPFFTWNERKVWHNDIRVSPESVKFTDSSGRVWFIREYPEAGRVAYAAEGQPYLVGEMSGTIEDALTVLDGCD